VPNPASSPTVRRKQLGTLLRSLRSEKGLTVDEVAGRIGVSPSKVSRLENGHRGASATDIENLSDLYEVDDEQREHLVELAREGKQRATWQPTGLPYSTYVGLEADAASISDFGLGIMPGLLQTADYARAVVRAAVPKWPPSVVERRVSGRMARQNLLLSDNYPQFDAVIDESVLHRVVGSPSIMRAQLERLLELCELPAVTVRVIPYDAGALPAGNNKFIILRFALADMSDVVFVEGLTGDLYINDPHEVDVYRLTFKTLGALAADANASRQLIAARLAKFRPA
jgi:transcriptional regulator with XRE-family HTH domain